jgi:hypothetical protein
MVAGLFPRLSRGPLMLFMANISLFKRLPEKDRPHIADEQTTISDFLSAVRFGKWKDQIEAIRKVEDKKVRDGMKRNLPSVTVSGTFRERKAELMLEHSGFISIDIDGYTDRTELNEDPYTYALFGSASGRGLVVLVRINPDKHKESFRWIQDYYFKRFGIVVDPAPSSVASLRYVSFDPDLFINEKAKKSQVKAEPKSAPPALAMVLPESVVGEMCAEVQRLGIDIAPDYLTYFRMGCAIANGFGESGRAMFHALCQPSPKYISSQADKKYNECLRVGAKSKITVGTLYYLLKQNGIHAPKNQQSQRAVQVAALGKRAGRAPEAIAEQLVQLEGFGKEQAERIVDEVMSRDDIDLKRVSNNPENLIEGLMEFLKTNHPIRRNGITGKLEEVGNEVSKERLNTIFLRARGVFDTKDVTFDLIERIIFSDFTNDFNPIREYIDRNRHRNTSGNIKALADTIKTDTPNHEMFIRRWVIGWVAALDGHPVRSVLTLLGGQNTGKTEWFRRLPPSALRKYYAESKLDAGKDDEILMCQKLWVMDDEMGGKSKQDEKRLKELTSKSTFSLRAPYGRHNEDYKRLAVLCGTSNEEAVLNDPTGNTRILPIRVISIDHEAYNAIDKDELFMEAVRLYDAGEAFNLTREELAHLEGVGADFETTPYERELICKFFIPVSSGGGYAEWLTSTDIKDAIESGTKQRIMALKRFGIELVNLFGKAQVTRVRGVVGKRYHVIRLNGESGVTGNNVDTQDDMPF